MLFDQLGASIAAGIPLMTALEMAGRNPSSGISPKVIQELTHHLREGHTFTDAMQLLSGQKRVPGIPYSRARKQFWLAEFDMAMLSTGEETGRLDASFKLLARYYTSRAKIIRDTISSLFITVITLHVFLMVFPLGYLIGFAQGIMNNQNAQCLPFIIEKIVVFGGIYGLVWFLIFACQGNRGEGWRAMVESFFNLIPMLRTAVKYLAVARLSMALDALMNAGVPVIRAWEMAAAASGSAVLKHQVLKWLPQLETGTTPAEMVAQISYFPEMFTHLYNTGEMSGKLDETLQRLHSYFEEEGFHKLQAFSRVLNFVIYLCVAITIAIFVISFWTQYYGAAMNGV